MLRIWVDKESCFQNFTLISNFRKELQFLFKRYIINFQAYEKITPISLKLLQVGLSTLSMKMKLGNMY